MLKISMITLPRYFSRGLVMALAVSAGFMAAKPSQAAILTVTPAATTLTPAQATTPMTRTFSVSGGTAPYSFYLTFGSLPPGLSLAPQTDSTAILTGTPTTVGTYQIHLGINDSAGSVTQKDYTLTVYPESSFPPYTSPNITTASIADALEGRDDSYAFIEAGGGVGPYTWSVSAGLPSGVTTSNPDNRTLALSGAIPVGSARTYTFTVRLTDVGGASMERIFAWNIVARRTVVLSPPSSTALPEATSGAPYTFTFTGSGGYDPHRVIESRSIDDPPRFPPGLTLNINTGVLGGMPTTAGTYTFGLYAVDAHNVLSLGGVYTIRINAAASPTPSPSPSPVPSSFAITTSLPGGTVGTWYGQNMLTSGGTPPYMWNFPSGTMPPGLFLDPTGSVYGTPSAAGTYTFNIEARDGTGTWAVRNYTVTIQSAASVTPSPTPAPTPTPSPTPPPSGNPLLDNLARRGIEMHALLKLPDDGDPRTQEDSAVYYIGTDGKRHAFPNAPCYFSWYADFSGVRTATAADLASIPLGANITYKPGARMVKFQTDPKVYAVAERSTLRWVGTEALAIALYGSSWNRQIDDISDAFYINYRFGANILTPADYSPSIMRALVRYPSQNF